jgi:cell division transport system permease protein
MRAITYFVREAFISLWRGRRSTTLSIVTIAAAVLVLGGFLLITSNLQRVIARWSESAELSVYLRDGISPEEQAAVDRLLADSALVTAREYVSKDDAVGRFREDFPDLAAAAAVLSDNPFPASIEVRLKAGDTSGEALEQLARRLARAPGVSDVRYDRQWIERAAGAIALVQWAGFVLAAILIVAAGLTVANVVRLALYARQDEIEIQQLVGAPLAYIRGPFVMEGILQGGAGAILAALLLHAGYVVAHARFARIASSAIDASLVQFLPASHVALLILGGMVVGCAGGLVAARSVR